MFIMVVRI